MHTTTSGSAALAPGLHAGFDDIVGGAQQTFRLALQALAHPGRVYEIAAPCGVAPGLSPAMTALLLTLADGDTPLWLPRDMPSLTRQFLRFHCGCPMADDAANAAFVAVPAGFSAPLLGECRQGDAHYPDRSATLLLEVDSLQDGTTLTLAGPGIATRQHLSVQGLPADFLTQWQANSSTFPMGVDVLLVHGRQLCGLPRTTRMES